MSKTLWTSALLVKNGINTNSKFLLAIRWFEWGTQKTGLRASIGFWKPWGQQEPSLPTFEAGRERHYSWGWSAFPFQQDSNIAQCNICPNEYSFDSGQTVEKEQLTNDQSFEWSSSCSVNKRVNLEGFLTCMFRKALLMMVMWTIAARRK